MLSQALGSDKVVVRASVEVETGQLKQKDEIYDPDKTAVVSERRIKEEEKTKQKNEIGPPGTSTNVPPIMDIGQDRYVVEKNKEDRTTNYDVSKSIIDKSQPIFKIKKISVGVLIDGKYEEVKDKNGNISYKFIPRSSEEIKQYEELVKSAIGFDPQRGDKVTVVSIPFERKPEVVFEQKTDTKKIAILAVAGILFLTLLIIGIAILLRSRKKPEEYTSPYGIAPETLATMAAVREKEIEVGIEKESEYIQLLKIAEENPQLISNLIKSWLKE
jgi:flagellar M-ring protein FliF